MINKVILIGRLTRDIELRKTPNGASTVSCCVAVDRKVKAQQDTDFINCVAWNKTAELMAQYLHKGSLIGVEGRIQTRSYDNQQGQRVYVTEVVIESISFLEPKHYDTNPSQTGLPTKDPYTNQYNKVNSNEQQHDIMNDYKEDDALEIASDDLPF